MTLYRVRYINFNMLKKVCKTKNAQKKNAQKNHILDNFTIPFHMEKTPKQILRTRCKNAN